MNNIYLWLDDIRKPPSGDWSWVRNINDAKALLVTGKVIAASLDHDLGACDICLNGRNADEWLEENDYSSMPHCEHVGTGYDLCLWMAETGNWPATPPNVHSANPVGRQRMLGVIERYFKF